MIDNNVIPVLEREDVIVNDKKIEEGLSLEKYLPFKLVEWEIFLFALIVGVTYTDGTIYFDEIRIIVGRGSGKNGFVDFLCLYFISPYHGVKNYNIDLLANSEKQVMTSFMDVYNILNEPEEKYKKVLKQHFKVNKEEIVGRETNSILRYNTSSKRGKDSKRTGCIIFDEVHEYQDSDNMNTLKSGMGKIESGRIIEITTDGHTREGVLDKEKNENKDILKQYDPDNSTLVFWCRIEEEEEWKDINKIVKAIPSLEEPSFKTLKRRIIKEIRDMPKNMDYFSEFITKRCNYPVGDMEIQVATWDDILATNQEFIDLEGKTCVGAIDYAKTNDFVACVLLFRKEGKVYVIHHSFVCAKSRDLPGIKAPIKEWAEEGYCEIVEDVEIPPEMVAGWFKKQMLKFNIIKIAIDNFRYTLMNAALKKIGFEAYEKNDKKKSNVFLTHKWEVIKIAPVINSLFVKHNLVYGDEPMMRWYTNNTKKVTVNGNMSYAKIEENYRKTDGFMAFVAGMTLYDEIPEIKDVAQDLLLDVAVY